MNKWISVKDRLPKCDTQPDSFGVEVLVWPQPHGVGMGQATAFYGARVTDEPDFYLHGALVCGVTHWMPLPEGPQ